MSNWFHDMFIDEAKPALDRYRYAGSDSETNTYILVDESGAEIPAVLVDEVTVFDATANDIREGKIAATEDGVTVGTKEIPAYHTYDAYRIVPNGSNFTISHPNYDYTKFQSIICEFNKNLLNSVAATKVSVYDNVYDVGSTTPISSLTKDESTKSIDLGITNESGGINILRYIMYKEIY